MDSKQHDELLELLEKSEEDRDFDSCRASDFKKR